MAGDPRGTTRGIALRAGDFFSTFSLLGLIIAVAALFAYFKYKLPDTFLTFTNIETIAKQATITSMASLGMTLIIISAGIDLSIGSGVALITVVIALSLQHHAGWFAILIALIAGAAMGLFNGTVISKVNVSPFIVTLGTLLMFRGLAREFGHDTTVSSPDTWINNLFNVLGPNEHWKLFPLGVWFMLAMAAGTGILLRRTVFGRHVVAIGSNETAARMSGVNVERVKISVYVLGGIAIALAGTMQFSRLSVGDPTVAVGFELDVIAAVVIGGASLNGGQGSILGSLIGAVFMTTIQNGFAQLGWPESYRIYITGAIIIFAVALDQRRQGKTSWLGLGMLVLTLGAIGYVMFDWYPSLK
ncbi:MAG TPA: ABC transporter permease [Fimbriimonadaceae bacterium]|nr:ABC transporter permease [Fimbriimonadaceae bacterium]